MDQSGLKRVPSELISIKWDAIDFDKWEVSIYAAKSKIRRTIPIIEAKLFDHLVEWRNMTVTPYIMIYNGKQEKGPKNNPSSGLCNWLGYSIRFGCRREAFVLYNVGE